LTPGNPGKKGNKGLMYRLVKASRALPEKTKKGKMVMRKKLLMFFNKYNEIINEIK
jgi:hypothetical protein